MTPLSPDAIELLTQSGWTEDRKVDIGPYVKALEARGFEVFDAAKKFLEKFGGIFVYDDPRERHLGAEVGEAMRKSHGSEHRWGRWSAKFREWFWPVEYKPHEALLSFDPTLDTMYVRHILIDYASRLERKVCYIGLYGKSNQTLMIDEAGAIYMGFKEELCKIADNVVDGVDRLVRKDVGGAVEVPAVDSESAEEADAVNATGTIARAWDAMADNYVHAVRDLDKRAAAVEIELAAFLRALPRGRTLELLDAGCGVGAHGCRLLAAGHNVTFLDVSPKMLDKARTAAEGTGGGEPWFDESDVRDMERMQTEAFDGVISGGTVVSDCGDPERAAAEIARVLKPGGVAGISLRNREGPDAPESGGSVRRQHEAFDAWFFSVNSVRELFGRAGLTVERVVPVFLSRPPHDERDLRDYVRKHVDAGPPGGWSGRAWELFVIARKPEPDKDEPEVEHRVMRH